MQLYANEIFLLKILSGHISPLNEAYMTVVSFLVPKLCLNIPRWYLLVWCVLHAWFHDLTWQLDLYVSAFRAVYLAIKMGKKKDYFMVRNVITFWKYHNNNVSHTYFCHKVYEQVLTQIRYYMFNIYGENSWYFVLFFHYNICFRYSPWQGMSTHTLCFGGKRS